MIDFSTGACGRVAGRGVSLSFEWWPGRVPVLCLPGLTSHKRAFAVIAGLLSPAYGLLAFDLRGRGDSDKPEGPYGMAVHAEDMAAALDEMGVAEPVVVVGHSMGAYAAAAFAAAYPDRTGAVVFLDGGILQARFDGDPDFLFDLVLGAFVGPLRRDWASVDDLVQHYSETPLYKGRVDDAVRQYFAYDLAGDQLRLKCSETAARQDWRDLVANPASWTNLEGIRAPALLVRARLGLTGADDDVVPDAARDEMSRLVTDLSVVDLPAENHHTMLTTRSGAASTAAAVRDFLDRVT